MQKLASRVPHYQLEFKTYGKPHQPQVILLHGIATSSIIWQKLVDELSSNHHVVVLDLLGHGKSPKPTNISYTAQIQAQSIHYTLAINGLLHPSIIVGFSIGALIATRFSVMYPYLVESLVVAAPPIYQQKTLDHRRLLDRSYQVLYSALAKLPKKATLKTTASLQRRTPQLMGKNRLCEETWHPIFSSLAHTVQEQSFSQDIQYLNQRTKMYLLYGAFDHLVIAKHIHAAADSRSQTHIKRILAPHAITSRYVKAINQTVHEISSQTLTASGSAY